MISVNALREKLFAITENETYDMKSIYNIVEDDITILWVWY